MIFASGSPTRKFSRRRLLEAAGLAFEVLPADVDEAGITQRASAACTSPQVGQCGDRPI
jgi:predicted house-cleaning NTP pyrophosphatase (Maf/HAM1 superfamily)